MQVQFGATRSRSSPTRPRQIGSFPKKRLIKELDHETQLKEGNRGGGQPGSVRAAGSVRRRGRDFERSVTGDYLEITQVSALET